MEFALGLVHRIDKLPSKYRAKLGRGIDLQGCGLDVMMCSCVVRVEWALYDMQPGLQWPMELRCFASEALGSSHQQE